MPLLPALPYWGHENHPIIDDLNPNLHPIPFFRPVFRRIFDDPIERDLFRY